MGSDPTDNSVANATAAADGYVGVTITALDGPDDRPSMIRVPRGGTVDPTEWRSTHLEPLVLRWLDLSASETGRYRIETDLPAADYSTTWIAEHGPGDRAAHVVHNERGVQLAVYLAGAPCAECRPEPAPHTEHAANTRGLPLGPPCARAADHAARDAAIAGGTVMEISVADTGDVMLMTRAARAAAKRSTDADRLYERTVEGLKPAYELFTPHYRDRLEPRQIQLMLSSSDTDDEVFDHYGHEWVGDHRWHAIEAILNDLLDDDERDELEHHNLLDALREEIVERDTSHPELSLLRNSPSMLLRYDLNVAVPPAPTSDAEQYLSTLAEIAEAAGLDTAVPAVSEALDELLAHAYNGGRLYMIWYGEPYDGYQLAHPPARRSHAIVPAPPVAVEFTNAHLLVLDHFNGSGHEASIERITTPWSPGRVSVDAARVGPGWSWTDTSGPHLPAYSAQVTAVAPTIPADPRNWPECHCGNNPCSDGFYPVDDNGEPVEPTPQDWTSNLMRCAKCGLVYDNDSYDPRHGVFTIVGRVVQAASTTPDKAEVTPSDAAERPPGGAHE
ncbi:hypothetical protein [Saccharothrix sp.]|uniref:hypothetical protein n=1 Tax=Saccharothrix sp. TaxID=1873460 RepID=UPI0028120508|nr:hypothetical protein [Saccharothrix sp.]